MVEQINNKSFYTMDALKDVIVLREPKGSDDYIYSIYRYATFKVNDSIAEYGLNEHKLLFKLGEANSKNLISTLENLLEVIDIILPEETVGDVIDLIYETNDDTYS